MSMQQRLHLRSESPPTFSENDMRSNVHALAVEIYTLTLQFPRHEAMVMIPLLRKLSLSIVSNVAKGFSAREFKEFMFFITYANASCHGIKALSEMAKDIGYITMEQNDSIIEKCSKLASSLRYIVKELELRPDNACYRKIRKRLKQVD